MKGLFNYGELKRSLKYAVVHKHLYTLVRYAVKKSLYVNTLGETQRREITVSAQINPVTRSNSTTDESDMSAYFDQSTERMLIRHCDNRLQHIMSQKI